MIHTEHLFTRLLRTGCGRLEYMLQKFEKSFCSRIHRKQYYYIMINVILNNMHNQTGVHIIFYLQSNVHHLLFGYPHSSKYLILCSAQERY